MIAASELILNPDGSVYHINLSLDKSLTILSSLVTKTVLKKSQNTLILLSSTLKNVNSKPKPELTKEKELRLCHQVLVLTTSTS